ncbi:MAG: ASCH domain-containing protein [Caulobacteraceae bacterium]
MTDLFQDTETTTMKALSLWQPWASLVAAGVKLHETRHWSTPYRGPIAIHAAKTLDVAGAPDLLCRAVFGDYWSRLLPLGMVVAVAELTACRPTERIADHLSRADLAAGNFSRGRFAWRLDKVRALKRPMPAVGRQGLFNWIAPEDLEAVLGPILSHAAACQAIGWN